MARERDSLTPVLLVGGGAVLLWLLLQREAAAGEGELYGLPGGPGGGGGQLVPRPTPGGGGFSLSSLLGLGAGLAKPVANLVSQLTGPATAPAPTAPSVPSAPTETLSGLVEGAGGGIPYTFAEVGGALLGTTAISPEAASSAAALIAQGYPAAIATEAANAAFLEGGMAEAIAAAMAPDIAVGISAGTATAVGEGLTIGAGEAVVGAMTGTPALGTAGAEVGAVAAGASLAPLLAFVPVAAAAAVGMYFTSWQKRRDAKAQELAHLAIGSQLRAATSAEDIANIADWTFHQSGEQWRYQRELLESLALASFPVGAGGYGLYGTPGLAAMLEAAYPGSGGGGYGFKQDYGAPPEAVMTGWLGDFIRSTGDLPSPDEWLSGWRGLFTAYTSDPYASQWNPDTGK